MYSVLYACVWVSLTLKDIHEMFAFILFSLFYPVNLYIFEFFFINKNRKPDENLKLKVASITFSCLILFKVVGSNFDFTWNWRILKWFCIGIAPFLIPLYFNEISDEEKITNFIFWRNFIIAPSCEELYYRILLPKIKENIWLLSISFSLAHAHPLIFSKNWNRTKFILSQCFISFCFGFICNALKLKMTTSLNNFWVLLTLSTIHGIANYCGVPLIELQKGKNIFYTQIIVLISSLCLIIKK